MRPEHIHRLRPAQPNIQHDRRRPGSRLPNATRLIRTLSLVLFFTPITYLGYVAIDTVSYIQERHDGSLTMGSLSTRQTTQRVD